jgi:hypothetical protein
MSEVMRESVRTCVGCRRRAPRSALVAMTLAGGPRWLTWPPQVSFGFKRCSAGRAAHLHRSVECVRRGTERGALEHALRVPKGSLEKGSLEQARQVLLSEVLASVGSEPFSGTSFSGKAVSGEKGSAREKLKQATGDTASVSKASAHRRSRVRL